MEEPCFVMTISDNPNTNNTVPKSSETHATKTNEKDDQSFHTNGNGAEKVGAYTNPINCLEEEEGLDKFPPESEEGLDITDSPTTVPVLAPTSARAKNPLQVCVKGKCGANVKEEGFPHSIGKTIDRICRVIFPALFVAFNAAYWEYYIIVAERPTISF